MCFPVLPGCNRKSTYFRSNMLSALQLLQLEKQQTGGHGFGEERSGRCTNAASTGLALCMVVLGEGEFHSGSSTVPP